MLSKYIKDLLKTQNRVIVPDLGAFLQKGDALKTIYFNEFLKFNDELLVTYISDQEHIEITDAARMIKNFTLEIRHKLQTDRSATLDDIGTLYLDKNEKIQLRTNFSFSLIPDSAERLWKKHVRNLSNYESNSSKKKEDFSTTSEFEIKDQSIEFETNISRGLSQESTSKHETESLDEDFKFRSVFTNKKMMVIFAFFLVLLASAYFVFLQPVRETKSTHAPYTDSLKAGVPEKSANESLYKDNTNNHNVLSLKKEMEARPTGINENKTAETTGIELVTKPPVTTPSKIAERSSDTAKAFSKQTFASSINTSEKKYYLVAGSYSQEANADNMLKKLNTEGYNAEKLSLSDGHFYVSYNSFVSKRLADLEIRRLKAIGISGIWLYYY